MTVNKTLHSRCCSYRTSYALGIYLHVLRPNTCYMPEHNYSLGNTLQSPKGELLPITVSPYGCLVAVDHGWLNSQDIPVTPEGVRKSYQLTFHTLQI